MVLHRCDNPPCSNPKHLYLGTQSDNVQDAFNRGRKSQKGSRNNLAKLNESKVEQIRKLYKEGKKQIKLASQYGVNQQCISLIVNNKRWHAKI